MLAGIACSDDCTRKGNVSRRRQEMSKWYLWFLIAVLTFSSPATDPAAEKHGISPDITLRGEIVDLACYIGHGAKGPEHQKCAAKCAELGQPLGLLSTDGKLYILVADHQDPSALLRARKLAGEQVEMSGEP